MESTGNESLDKILGGGLPRPSAISIYGPIGSGKSILAKQIVANTLKEGVSSCLFYAVDQSAKDIKDDLESMGVPVEKHEADGSLCFVDMFTLGVERVRESYTKLETGTSVLQSGLQFSDLIEKGREFSLKNLKRKQIVVMDSITPFFLMSDAKEVFHYCQTMVYATRFANAIGIAINHSGVLDEKLENAFYGFADGLIELKKSSTISSGPVIGVLKVDRMMKQKFLKGNFYYEIKDNQIVISMVRGIV